MQKSIEMLLQFIGLLAIMVIFNLFLAFPIMWCWNHAVVDIFKLQSITWSQAWCLSFLSSMLIQSSLSHNVNK